MAKVSSELRRAARTGVVITVGLAALVALLALLDTVLGTRRTSAAEHAAIAPVGSEVLLGVVYVPLVFVAVTVIAFVVLRRRATSQR